MASYPYVVLPGPKPVYKPWIRVMLGYEKTHKVTHGVVALVDSGADVCFCTLVIELWLGIRSRQSAVEEFIAANRTTLTAYREVIVLLACGKKYNCPFYFTKDLPRETPIILGQIGFFDHFKITFDLPRRTLDII